MSNRVSNCCGAPAYFDQMHEDDGVFVFTGLCQKCREHCSFELEGEEPGGDFSLNQQATISAIVNDAENEAREEDVIEKVHIARAMKKYGGSFVKALSEALLMADHENTSKIKKTWPDYWGKYTAFARAELQREQNQKQTP